MRGRPGRAAKHAGQGSCGDREGRGAAAATYRAGREAATRGAEAVRHAAGERDTAREAVCGSDGDGRGPSLSARNGERTDRGSQGEVGTGGRERHEKLHRMSETS